MNTKVTIIYRDMDNFKTFRNFVFAGVFDPGRVKSVVGEECMFIPEEVGIDRLCLGSASGLPTSRDVVYHELHEDDFELTDEKPNDPRTIDEFLDALEKAPCNELEALNRLYEDGMQIYGEDEDGNETYAVLTKEQALDYLLYEEVPEDLDWERF